MKQFTTHGTLNWIYHDALKQYRESHGWKTHVEKDGDADEEWDEPLDILDLFAFLDSGSELIP